MEKYLVKVTTVAKQDLQYADSFYPKGSKEERYYGKKGALVSRRADENDFKHVLDERMVMLYGYNRKCDAKKSSDYTGRWDKNRADYSFKREIVKVEVEK